MPGQRRGFGFALIEVLFGFFLLAIAAIVLASIYPVAARLQTGTRYRAQAVRIARRQMEAVKRLPFGTLGNASLLANAGVAPAGSAASPYSFTNLAADGADQVSSALPSGTGSFTIQDVSLTNPNTVSATQTNLRRITVTVTWIERGQTRSVVLQTLVSNLEAPRL